MNVVLIEKGQQDVHIEENRTGLDKLVLGAIC